MKTLYSILFLAVFCVNAQAKTAPSFRGELLSGGKTSLDACLKKDRLLFVSFWAVWCIPCQQELAKVQEKLKADPKFPMDVLTVNIDREQRNEIPATMRQSGFDFPVVLDPSQDIFSKYQKAGTLPYSLVVSADKTVQEEFSGYHDSMFGKIETVIDKLKIPRK